MNIHSPFARAPFVVYPIFRTACFQKNTTTVSHTSTMVSAFEQMARRKSTSTKNRYSRRVFFIHDMNNYSPVANDVTGKLLDGRFDSSVHTTRSFVVHSISMTVDGVGRELIEEINYTYTYRTFLCEQPLVWTRIWISIKPRISRETRTLASGEDSLTRYSP